jgi:hypothetical protein
VSLLAAVTDVSLESLLTQWGPLGILAALGVVFFKITTTKERERNDRAEARERDRSDKAEAQRDELNMFLRDKFMPSLIRSQELEQRVTQALAEAVQALTEIRMQRDIEERNRRRDGS